jgi:hypothetical protein
MRPLGHFEYLGEKIQAASFREVPFAHLYIEQFLSDEHLNLLLSQKQISLSVHKTTIELINTLSSCGWEIQAFPGCTTSVHDYLKYYESNEWPVDNKRVEGFGIAYELGRYDDNGVAQLIEYLNCPHFKNILENKFRIHRPNKIHTAIHKYLSGYEISPHPDVRSKCLTYLININTDRRSEELPIHTHLLKFKDEKRFIYDFWKFNCRTLDATPTRTRAATDFSITAPATRLPAPRG